MTKKPNLSDYCTQRWGIPQNTVKWQAPILANWVAKDVLTAAEFMVFVTSHIPGKIYMNKLMIKPFTNVVKDLIKLDLLDEIKTWDGVFHIRKLTGSKTRWSVHCVPKGGLVYQKNGYSKIEDLKVGDKVLSLNKLNYKLEEKSITNIFSGKKKNILSVKIRNYNIRCSEDHPVLVLKKQTLKKSEYIPKKTGRGQTRALYTTEFVKARDLKRGDKVVIMKSADNMLKSGDNNLLWFEVLGLFIGDGCFHNRNRGRIGSNYVSFSFPKNDRSRSYVIKILSKEFSSISQNDRAIFLYRKVDYERFRKYNFKACDKFVPNEVLKGTREQKTAFLKGLIYSDGSIMKTFNGTDKNKFTVKYGYKTCSRSLMEGIKYLCTQIGIKTSNIVENRPCTKIVNGVIWRSKVSYNMMMADYNNLIKLDGDALYKEAQALSVPFKTYGSHCWGYELLGDSFSFESVIEITADGKEAVYDIEVKDNHNFILNGVIVSNSYGLGLDFNASENPIGKVGKMKKEVIKVFTDHGFTWGGVWARRDDMHFEYDPRAFVDGKAPFDWLEELLKETVVMSKTKKKTKKSK